MCERERERQTDRKTDRHRQTHTHTDRDGQRQTETEKDRKIKTQKERRSKRVILCNMTIKAGTEYVLDENNEIILTGSIPLLSWKKKNQVTSSCRPHLPRTPKS